MHSCHGLPARGHISELPVAYVSTHHQEYVFDIRNQASFDGDVYEEEVLAAMVGRKGTYTRDPCPQVSAGLRRDLTCSCIVV
jgi:hypothetical protein